MNTTILPALMSISDFRAWSRLGRTRIYEEIGTGRLPILKIGRRTFVRAIDAEAWLASYAQSSACHSEAKL